MKNIIALDFDGTLFFHKEQPRISDKDKEAIRYLQSQGYVVGLNTGRAVNSIQEHIMEAAGIDFDFYITNSGAVIADRNKNIIEYSYIDKDAVAYLLNTYPINNVSITFNGTDYVNPGYLTEEKKLFCDACPDWDTVLEHDIQGMVYVFNTEKEAAKFRKEISKLGLNIHPAQNRKAVDIYPQGVDKGVGLNRLRELFGWQQTYIVAVGDGYNDTFAFNNADYGVAIKGCCKELKNCADIEVNKFYEILDFMPA